MTPFSDSDALVVTKETAEREGLKEIGDLAKLGGQPEFETRPRGLVGVKEKYGLESDIQFTPFAGISPCEALDQGTVDVAAIFSIDPPLASDKYVVLEDTEPNFGFQNVAPVVNQELADELGADREGSGLAFAQFSRRGVDLLDGKTRPSPSARFSARFRERTSGLVAQSH